MSCIITLITEPLTHRKLRAQPPFAHTEGQGAVGADQHPTPFQGI